MNAQINQRVAKRVDDFIILSIKRESTLKLSNTLPQLQNG